VRLIASKSQYFKKACMILGTLGLLFMMESLFAAGKTIGTMASSITSSFANVTKMITGGCYLAGLAFSVTAILQFKQHKDNPTQVTIGKPIALVFIAAALLFMPSILSVAGYTMFGEQGQVAGSKGKEFQ